MKVTTSDGVELDVRLREGTDAAFVLVHGLASSAGLWEAVAVRLAGQGATVASIDLRGHGRSDAPEGLGLEAWSTDRVVADVAEVIDALGLEQPVIAGQSWGGNVVIELGHQHPQLVRSVMAVDGGLIHLSDQFADFEACWSVLAPPVMTGITAERVLGMHPSWEDRARQGVLDCFVELPDGTLRSALTRERHRAVLRGLWDHDPWAALPLPVPLTIVAARGGLLARQLGRAPGAVELILDGGHDLHAERPAEIADLLWQQLL